ncbi:MAG: hypothetical protein ACYSPJ_00530 [Planctomycetota bacterium]|jgi:hypothetical protein
MTSQKQIAANRKNAQKSTGPRTEQGKSTVAHNAIKHGLRSNRVLITSDDPHEFAKHHKALFKELAPVGPMEIFLTKRIIALSWHLMRATSLQSDSIDTLARGEIEQTQPQAEARPGWVYWDDRFHRKIGISSQERYEKMCDMGIMRDFVDNWIRKHPDQFEQISKELNYYEEPDPEPETEALSLGEVAVNDFSNTRVLDRLVMYERRIENSLYRTQLQLERLQLRRQQKEAEKLKNEPTLTTITNHPTTQRPTEADMTSRGLPELTFLKAPNKPIFNDSKSTVSDYHTNNY